MCDDTWVRVYNGKAFAVDNSIHASNYYASDANQYPLTSASGVQLANNGNLYMPWAGDWLSNVLGAKLPVNGAAKRAKVIHKTGMEGDDCQMVYLSNDGYFRGGHSWSGGVEVYAYDWQWKLGSPNYRWGQIYSTSAAISTSDRNVKKNIRPLTDADVLFLRKLIPSAFQMKDGTSGRTHMGFIAQEVEEAMIECGLTDLDFAGFCKDKKQIAKADEEGNEYYEDVLDEDGNIQYIYSLRYEEFIALNTKAIQYCMDKIDAQEERMNTIEERIKALEERMDEQ